MDPSPSPTFVVPKAKAPFLKSNNPQDQHKRTFWFQDRKHVHQKLEKMEEQTSTQTQTTTTKKNS
jgi:hypothetical protein